MVNGKRNLSTSKEVRVEFSLPNATLFGGALPMLTYMKKLKLVERFASALTFAKGPTSTYTLPQICVTQVTGRLLGKERIAHFEEMEQDKFLAKEIGLSVDKLPDTTTLYNDLDRFDTKEKIDMLKHVNDQINTRRLQDQHTVILDFDSSVETVLEDTLKRLPASIETLYCRGDKGFGGEKMFATCEERMIGYTIKRPLVEPSFGQALVPVP
jgi:hypothetical protein